jgi:hypothetical protein
VKDSVIGVRGELICLGGRVGKEILVLPVVFGGSNRLSREGWF